MVMQRRTFLQTAAEASLAALGAAPPEVIDATTLSRKVLCGYQGWFRTPKDGSGRGWVHWSRDWKRITADTVTFEMWPDVREYPAESLAVADEMKMLDGTPARLFSSIAPGVVDLHFRWMQEYGLDGALVQRFVSELQPDRTDRDTLLLQARVAAERTGRVFAVEYDLSGTPTEKIIETITGDWRRLVAELGITKSGRYLHHAGKPVVGIFGFFPDRFDAATAHRILDVFADDHVIGGCPWYWRRGAENDTERDRVFERFGTIAPWNVGNAEGMKDRLKAKTSTCAEDQVEAHRTDVLFMPVVYPGFGWDNLKKINRGQSTIDRRKGAFLWEQFVTASELQVDCLKVAMFDEVDEATAIFKVSDRPPGDGLFQRLHGLPSDYYLRLVGDATKRFHAGEPIPAELPRY